LTDTTDELKALLALGILASFAVFFQYSTDFSRYFGLPVISGALVAAEVYSEAAVALLFGGYVIGLCLSLGFERFEKFSLFSKDLGRLSDIFFVLGAISLLGVCLVYGVRILLAAI
jgi:uncharacterized membrane protein